MRKRNKVKQLHRDASHRNAMLANMVTSLFYHESIQSTVAKTKAARIVAEKLITRAKNSKKTDDKSAQIHDIRHVKKFITNKSVIDKLFNDIAVRVSDRNGGYTRITKIGKRNSDRSEMAVMELVDRVEEVKPEKKSKKAVASDSVSVKAEKQEKKTKNTKEKSSKKPATKES